HSLDLHLPGPSAATTSHHPTTTLHGRTAASAPPRPTPSPAPPPLPARAMLRGSPTPLQTPSSPASAALSFAVCRRRVPDLSTRWHGFAARPAREGRSR